MGITKVFKVINRFDVSIPSRVERKMHFTTETLRALRMSIFFRFLRGLGVSVVNTVFSDDSEYLSHRSLPALSGNLLFRRDKALR